MGQPDGGRRLRAARVGQPVPGGLVKLDELYLVGDLDDTGPWFSGAVGGSRCADEQGLAQTRGYMPGEAGQEAGLAGGEVGAGPFAVQADEPPTGIGGSEHGPQLITQPWGIKISR